MKSLLSVLLFTLMISCESEGVDKYYYVTFQLKDDHGSNHHIRVPQEMASDLSGNDILNSDSIAVGFEIRSQFVSPLERETNQYVSFFLYSEIPRDEFSFNSGSFSFKNPSRLLNYIPNDNLFESETLTILPSFHENVMTYCTASLDETYANTFRITRTRHYVDSNGDDALDIEGTFAIRFLAACSSGKIEIARGQFRAKILIDEIPKTINISKFIHYAAVDYDSEVCYTNVTTSDYQMLKYRLHSSLSNKNYG